MHQSMEKRTTKNTDKSPEEGKPRKPVHLQPPNKSTAPTRANPKAVIKTTHRVTTGNLPEPFPTTNRTRR